MTSRSSTTAVLSLRGVSKRFGVVQAVRNVSLECFAGEVHAVVGENGSGKSTLFGVASGVIAVDAGTVEIGGQRLQRASAAEAMRLGLGMAYQSFSTVRELSVAESMYVATPSEKRPTYGKMNVWAAAQLDEARVQVDARALTGSLSLAEQQMVEVVKALVAQPKVLLLDEPTTALGPGEVERLHALVRERAAEGVGVVYVSHRLPEVLGIADRVTVLRDGLSQGTFDARSTSEDAVIALMIGRPLTVAFPTRGSQIGRGNVLLRVERLCGDRFGPLDLDVCRGEILGVAGAEGNGQVQLLRSLAGVDRSIGSVLCNGVKVDLRSPLSALRAGVVLLSGDRAQSLFRVLGVRANATMHVLRRFSRAGWLRRSKEREAVVELVQRLKVRTASIEEPVEFLSGGNQQKVALMRPFLRGSVHVILADEPTQGVDVGSRFDIYEALRAQAKSGAAIIVKSSDVIELSGFCDRVIVMSRGRIVEELSNSEVTENRIIQSMVGSRREEPSEGPSDGKFSNRPAVNAASVRFAPRARAPRQRGWLPLGFLTALTVALGAYTASHSSAFLSAFNLSGLLIAAIPVALISMGQLSAMLIRGFDISVGALMTLCVVLASFIMTAGSQWYVLAGGALGVVGLALMAGTCNVLLMKIVGLPSLVATLATLSVFQGISLLLRPIPGGVIDGNVSSALTSTFWFVPVAFLGVVALAGLADLWLYVTRDGLVTRAVGLDEESARRLGVDADRIQVRAFLLCSGLTCFGAFFLAAQVGVGDATTGLSLALPSFSAAILGGASLAGGRGSFGGAVLAALFLSLVTNVLPFLRWNTAYGQIAVGALTLLALIAYRGGTVPVNLRVSRYLSLRSVAT